MFAIKWSSNPPPRGRQTMIDWMKSNDVEHEHIKKAAYDREDWRHWRPGPAWKDRAHKKKIIQPDLKRYNALWKALGVHYT